MTKELSPKFYSPEKIKELTSIRWFVGYPNIEGGFDGIEYFPTEEEAMEYAAFILRKTGNKATVQDMFEDDGSYNGE